MEGLCLAMAIYYESRGEPLQGQIAVGQVVMERVTDQCFPNTICGVITERNQFSFLYDDSTKKRVDPKAWDRSVLLSSALLSKDAHFYPYHRGARFYAATGVRKSWMAKMTPFELGSHTFYVNGGCK